MNGAMCWRGRLQSNYNPHNVYHQIKIQFQLFQLKYCSYYYGKRTSRNCFLKKSKKKTSLRLTTPATGFFRFFVVKSHPIQPTNQPANQATGIQSVQQYKHQGLVPAVKLIFFDGEIGGMVGTKDYGE